MLKPNEDDARRVQVEAIKTEWKLLWRSRIDDKVLAEGIANNRFSLLSVDRGTVIVATRDYKQLDLREILRASCVSDVDRLVAPPPSAGGWKKFARTVLNSQPHERRRRSKPAPCRSRGSSKNEQLKKGGRGWLHTC